jgi:hypothetical protein
MRFAFVVVLLAVALPAAAGILTEDFNAPFPDWESGWLGVNSNLVNYYVADGYLDTYRGNNPDGLWVADSMTYHGGNVIVSFQPSFAATLTSLSIGIEGGTAAPEPAAWGLIGAGLLALAGIGKRCALIRQRLRFRS